MTEFQRQQEVGRESRRNGIFHTLNLQFLKFGVQFISTLFFVRLVTPQQYGLFAIAVLTVATIDMVRDFGINDYSISHSQEYERLSLKILRFVLTNSIVSVAVLLFISAVCKYIFESTYFSIALLILTPTPFMNGINNFARNELLREKRISIYWFTDILASIMSSLVVLLLARNISGLYLLEMHLLLSSTLLFIFILFYKWRSIFRKLSRIDCTYLYRESRHFLFNRSIRFFGANSDTLIVGSTLGSTLLGNYNRAFQLIFAPIQQTTESIGNLAISRSLNTVDTFDELINSLKRYHNALLSFMMPILIFISLNSKETIQLLYGPNWANYHYAIVILSFGGTLYLNYSLLIWILLATRQSKRLWNFNLAVNLMLIISFLLASKFGIYAVCACIPLCYLLINIFAATKQCLVGQLEFGFYFKEYLFKVSASLVTFLLVRLGVDILSNSDQTVKFFTVAVIYFLAIFLQNSTSFSLLVKKSPVIRL
jgi:PST family polysaccharide transporter